MHVAIYCTEATQPVIRCTNKLIALLHVSCTKISITNLLEGKLPPLPPLCSWLVISEPIDTTTDYLLSVGGDGTLLRAAVFVKDSNIPILGINTGRLGFLTGLTEDTLNQGIAKFLSNHFTLVKRSLLGVKVLSNTNGIKDERFALNEVSINRKDTTNMLSVAVKIDGNPLTTYWADGLIIATPTGSTSYSMSSGGPIIAPETSCLILNPLAPHNITMRPLIVDDNSVIEIIVDGRGDHHLLSLDSRIYSLTFGSRIIIRKAKFFVYTILLQGDFFFKTIREKFFWGLDTRNQQ